MKITKRQLGRIIKEEKARLQEAAADPAALLTFKPALDAFVDAHLNAGVPVADIVKILENELYNAVEELEAY